MAIEPTIVIAHTEQAGSPSYAFDESGRLTAERRFWCAWASGKALARAYKGGYNDEGVLLLPALFPGETAVRCQSARVRGIGAIGAADDEGLATYTNAEVVVTYGHSTATTTSEKDEAHSFSGHAEYLTLNPDNVLWWLTEQDAVKADDAPGKLLQYMVWRATYKKVRTPPENCKNLMGYVNSAALTAAHKPHGLSGWTFAAGTIRLDNVELAETQDSLGTLRWDITLTMALRPPDVSLESEGPAVYGTATWNHFYPPGSAIPERIFTSAANRYDEDRFMAYPEGNLNALIASIKSG